MCMKNININVVFSDIQIGDDQMLSLFNVGKPVRVQHDDSIRKITQLSMAAFISATQSKDPKIIAKLNPDEVFTFSHKYELLIRLTETTSGKFKDIGHLDLDPATNDIHEGICRHTFNLTHLGIYQDISLPERKDDEKFVIKILIRRKTDGIQEKNWVVQTVVPFSLEDIAY